MKIKFVFIIGVVTLFLVFFFAFSITTAAEPTKDEIAINPILPTSREINFSTFTTKPILYDSSVRQAIAFCTDRWALARAAYPELTDPEIDALMIDSFLPSNHWAYTQPTTQYPFDPDQGRSLLEAAGWTVPEGGIYRVNDTGEPLALQLTTTWAEYRQSWGAVFEQQMLDCGIWVLRFHTDPTWWFGEYSGLVRRNFEIGGYAWLFEDDPQPISFYGCDQIPSAFNGWQGLNYMGWCNPEASAAAEMASDTNLTHEQRIPFFAILQEKFAQDVPLLPLFRRTESSAWEHIDFNFSTPPPPTPVLKDIDVRQAIAYCTDRWALARAAYPELTDPEIDALMMDSFLPSNHWAYTQPTTQYPFDPDQGRSLLEAAGWTVPEGKTYRVNDAGEPLALQLTTTRSDARYAWGAAFEQQMLDCGIWVLRFHTDPTWWFGEYSGLVRRNFEIGGYAWNFEDDPQPISFYGCDQIPSAFNGWQGLNYMGWCNPEASAAAEMASDTNLTHEQRIPSFVILQEEFAQDMPSLPLFMGANGWEHIDFNMFTPVSRIFIPVVNK